MNGYFDKGYGNWLPNDISVAMVTEDGIDVAFGVTVFEFDNTGTYFYDKNECFKWAKNLYGSEYEDEDYIWDDIMEVIIEDGDW